MTALFTSYVCDYCDGLKKVEYPYRGYVLWRGEPDPEGRDAYVFPSEAEAEKYRQASRRYDDQIREVWAEHEIKWHRGRGSVKGLSLADRVYKIFPDENFEPGPYRAFLAPD
jgi:hypothetical protein